MDKEQFGFIPIYIVMEALIYILKAFLLGWFIAHFEPIQEVLKPIRKRINDKYFVLWYFKNALACHKCLSFWTGLAISGNIYIAIAASLMAFIFDRTTKPTEIWKAN